MEKRSLIRQREGADSETARGFHQQPISVNVSGAHNSTTSHVSDADATNTRSDTHTLHAIHTGTETSLPANSGSQLQNHNHQAVDNHEHSPPVEIQPSVDYQEPTIFTVPADAVNPQERLSNVGLENESPSQSATLPSLTDFVQSVPGDMRSRQRRREFQQVLSLLDLGHGMDVKSSVLSAILTTVPILALYYIKNITYRLVAVVCFTVLFAVSLTLSYRPKRGEVFATTAA